MDDRHATARWLSSRPKSAGLGRGEKLVELEPSPVLRVITMDVAERGLALLGVEFDAFLDGEGEWATLQMPFSRAAEFFDIVLANSDQYDLKKMPLKLLRPMVETIAAAFFFACLATLKGLTPT